MTDKDWQLLNVAMRLSSNYSLEVGVALQKLIYEYGKLIGNAK